MLETEQNAAGGTTPTTPASLHGMDPVDRSNRTDQSASPRTQPPWAVGCLTFLGSGLAGYGVYRLSRAGRQDCGVVQEHQLSVLDWWMWEAPLTITAAAFAGLVGWALVAGVVRRAGRGVRSVVPTVAVVGVLGVLALVHFAWLGTPYAMGTISEGGCGDGNVPAWWPSWLPV
ncbi:hypothetical protein [Streptomyces albipurpureus]|uniref:Integral membrane protein n=1 Tax=Streptomyces albipurpureus TaxID=2897419 RepID=A0ABT0ULC0_9ACTN|nr:hypothetical protein [Streptomyces sp. CWNU-1]MCM2389234.1 hypothetical protein [Streptomyces sp. CWNU-1]